MPTLINFDLYSLEVSKVAAIKMRDNHNSLCMITTVLFLRGRKKNKEHRASAIRVPSSSPNVNARQP